PPAFFDDPVLWVRDEQQNFYGAMSKSMRAMNSEGFSAALTLMLLSLGYGVFHAAGPGHGKAVVSGWLLATETQLRRGILVAFMSAMLQAFVAVALVSALLLLVTGAAAAAKDMVGWLEVGSFAMIAAVGAYVLWGGLKVFPWKRAPSTHDHRFEIINPLPANHSHTHDHDDDHVHGPDCGHVHAPNAKEVDGDWSWKRAATLSMAVGLRPCTGAILVLLFSYSLGIYWAGVVSTFVMGFGTFLTVSAVAALSVYSKQLAQRYTAGDGRWTAWLNFALRFGGGIAILFFAGLMMIASWQGMGDSGF
ncbi:MAG: nickel/cobalt transporter, partial [Aestuariivirga sp.]